MYINVYFLASIPSTRILSFSEFVNSGQKKRIKLYILYLLSKVSEPLSSRQIHELSGIDICSLTLPLKELRNQNKIVVAGKTKNKTGRIALSYSLPTKADSND